jgi:hypothetical protein
MTCLRRRKSQGNRKIMVKVTFLQYFFKLEGSLMSMITRWLSFAVLRTKSTGSAESETT